MKGYKLWCLEPGQNKCLISRDVVFDETQMAELQIYKITQDSNVDSSKIEMEIEDKQTDHQRRSQPQIKDEVESDRQRRTIRAPTRYGHTDMVYYAYTTASDLVYSEPNSYKEMMKSKDKKKCLRQWMKKCSHLRRMVLGN